MHFPDPNTPIEETLRALDELVRQGKVRAIGCSNFSAAQVKRRETASHKHPDSAPFVTCQDEYSLLVRKIERDLVPLMQRARHDAPALRAARRRLPQRQVSPRQTAAQERAAGLQQPPRPDVINERNWALVERLRDSRRAPAAACSKSRSAGCWRGRSRRA